MAASGNNLLECLHKWATRQDENFLTEAFVHLLRHLVDHEPRLASAFLKKLTNDRLTLNETALQSLIISTQLIVPEGRPDIAMRTLDSLIVIEAKKESGLGDLQLERYRNFLKNSKVRHTGLVLLTRYPVPLTPNDERPDALLRWHQVSDWLDWKQGSQQRLHPATNYLAAQFVGYLQAEGMEMEQVTWELERGVRAWQNFLAMLHEAVESCGVPYEKRREGSWQYFYFDKFQFIVSISMDMPTEVWFGTWNAEPDKNKAEKLGKGQVLASDDPQYTGPYQWWNLLKLDSEEVHFFARSKASQMQCLEQFLRESLALARQVIVTSVQTTLKRPRGK